MVLRRAAGGDALLALCALLSVLAASAPASARSPQAVTLKPQTFKCLNDDDCFDMRHTTCDKQIGQCKCENGYSPMNPEECGKLLGDPCDERSFCEAPNSHCDKAVCSCIVGLNASRDGTVCYGKPLLYGDTCDHDDDCDSLGTNLYCKERSCVCKSNYKRTFGEVICKKKIGALDTKCNVTTEVCFENNISDTEESTRDCINGTCQCMADFVPDSGTCKKKISVLGAPCNETRHICYLEEDGGSQKVTCLDEVCQCRNSLVPDNQKCKKKIEQLAANCSQESDICYVETDGEHQTRGCIDGTCQCKTNFGDDGGRCKQKIGLVGASCNASTHMCYLEEDGASQKVHCSKDVCRCKDEFVLHNGLCKRKIGNIGENCTQNSTLCYVDEDGDHQKRECADGVCRCKKMFRNENNQCKLKIKLGALCNTTTDVCHLDQDGDEQRIQCEAGVCECRSEFVLQKGKCKIRTKSAASCLTPLIWLLPVMSMIQIKR